MKAIRLALAALFIVGNTQAAEEFEIKSYSPDTGTVEIKCAAGLTNRLFSSFSTNDQQKINDWLANETMMSLSGLSIEISQRKQRRDSDMTKGSGISKQITRGHADQISYSITVENRSQVALDDVTITYRLFYETKTGDEKTKKCANGTLASAAALMPGSRLAYKTEAISIRNESIETPGVPVGYSSSIPTAGAQVGYKPTVYITDRLEGLYVCVSRKDVNGNIIKRELKEGDVPEKEDWANYQQSAEQSSAQSGTNMATSPDSLNLSEEKIQRYVKLAEKGDYKAAIFLWGYYRRQGDRVKEELWFSKAKKLMEKLPAEEKRTIGKKFSAFEKVGP